MIRPLKETGEHSYHRRSFAHDYFAPFIYHIILKKVPACEPFGKIEGDAKLAPGTTGAACINESALGHTIAKSILHLPYEHAIIKLHQFCVMPDHVHLLLQVLYRSEQHLDFYVDSLKDRISAKHPGIEIFESGYCDKPLYDNRSLDGLYSYIRENPHRLAMRVQYPEFFQRCRRLQIGNKSYEAYGNLFLIRNPDKEAVKISRKFTSAETAGRKAFWRSSVAEGTILVSPFISQEEKAVRAEAEAAGAKIILITAEAFPERFKPAAHDFALCAEGRLLIISLGLPVKTKLTREQCLEMNALAQAIASL